MSVTRSRREPGIVGSADGLTRLNPWVVGRKRVHRRPVTSAARIVACRSASGHDSAGSRFLKMKAIQTRFSSTSSIAGAVERSTTWWRLISPTRTTSDSFRAVVMGLLRLDLTNSLEIRPMAKVGTEVGTCRHRVAAVQFCTSHQDTWWGKLESNQRPQRYQQDPVNLTRSR